MTITFTTTEDLRRRLTADHPAGELYRRIAAARAAEAATEQQQRYAA